MFQPLRKLLSTWRFQHHLNFDEVNIVLIKKITEEVQKLKLHEKIRLNKRLVKRIKKILKQHDIDYIFVSHRVKNETSIINKVIRKIDEFIDLDIHKPIEELVEDITAKKIMAKIHDLIGIRIVAKNEKDCYQIADLFRNGESIRMIPGESVDYIEAPKSNGYQAIHIVCKDRLTGKYFEVQIMTLEMDQKAEIGSAKRDKYKKRKRRIFYKNMGMVTLAAAGGALYAWSKRKKK